MRHTRTLCAAVTAALMMLALGAAGSWAAGKTTLHLSVPAEAERALAPGDFVEYEGTSVSLEGGSYHDTCASSVYGGFAGVAETNAEKTDRLKVDYAKSGFSGGKCEGNFPIGGTHEQFWANPSGEFGSLTITSTGKATLKAPTAGASTLELYDALTNGSCTYRVKTLKGTAEFNAPVLLSFVNQKVHLYAAKVLGCPKTALLTVGFTLWTAQPGSQAEAEAHGNLAIAGSVF